MANVKTSKTVFVCGHCGTVERKWHGQCPACSAWNSLAEQLPPAPASGKGARRGIGGVVSERPGGAAGGGGGGAPGPPGPRPVGPGPPAVAEPVILSEVRASRIRRIATGVEEFDRVLGGSDSAGCGLVPGSLVLLGGAPGIGKSTLIGAATGNLAAAGVPVLYVSGEESPEQIRLRHERLGEDALAVPVVAETDVERVIATIEAQERQPAVCVIDSVQTLYCAELAGAPGSVGQVREVAARLMQLAKSREIAIVLIGHVTKEGSLAGPRVLEHLVDCVLHFEGERERSFRMLRASKNRFGSVDELGVFEMGEHGLVEVSDASARFVADATCNAGSVVFPAIEGSRPMLVEIQALVSKSETVPARRLANGIDRNRLAMILAVLARHGGLALGEHDVFINVVGGVRIEEPAADLAVALAIVSAARGVALTSPGEGGRSLPLACFGEIGLTGELRSVHQADRRVVEAVKFGLCAPLVPGEKGDAEGLSSLRQAIGRAFTAAD
jgi:DNA repair protein RadA/Sms